MNAKNLSNVAAISSVSLRTTGAISAAGTIQSAGTITGNIVTGTNGLTGNSLSVSGNAGSGTVTSGAITASGLLNAQSGFNGTGSFSFIGNLADSVVLSTDANATGMRLQLGAMLLTCPAAFSLNAGGAGNLSAGGAISIAAGDYIDLNAGHVDFIGGSEARVNTIVSYNTGIVSFNSPLAANANIATPSLIVNSITRTAGAPVSIPVGIQTVSTITDLSTINGVPVSQFLNQTVSTFNFVGANVGQISTLTVNTINGFPYSPSNSLTGLDLYLDTAGGTTPQTGALLASPNTGTQTLITSGNQTNATVLVASFISGVGVVQNTSIIQGFWNLGLYTSPATTSGISVYYSAYYVDADGVSNKTAIAVGTSANAVPIPSGVQALTNIDLFVPATTLPNTTKRIQIDVYGIFVGGSKNLTMEFRGNSISHLHTTIIGLPQNVTFNTASISSLNASSISAYFMGITALETASIERVSTLNASSITTNFIATTAIETASIDRVSTLNASSITTNFITVGQIENVSSITVSTINGLPTVPFVAQYYKNATQNFPTGLTDVTWQVAQPWTNTGGYITQTNATTFTVQRPGVYQFEFAASISANGQTWTTVPTKDIRINVTRSPGTAQALFFNRITPQNPLDWANSVIGTGALTTGDTIVCNLGQTLTTAGNCLIQSLSNVFDTNTAFTWTLVKPL